MSRDVAVFAVGLGGLSGWASIHWLALSALRGDAITHRGVVPTSLRAAALPAAPGFGWGRLCFASAAAAEPRHVRQRSVHPWMKAGAASRTATEPRGRARGAARRVIAPREVPAYRPLAGDPTRGAGDGLLWRGDAAVQSSALGVGVIPRSVVVIGEAARAVHAPGWRWEAPGCPASGG